MSLIKVGIDPGKHTGIAAFSVKSRSLILCETDSIIGAMETIKDLHAGTETQIEVVFEDARKRKFFGNTGRERLQGAGSVKRDSGIWEEFLKYHQIPYSAVAPQKGKTKINAAVFARMTGWKGRTSVHARDAALIVVNSR